MDISLYFKSLGDELKALQQRVRYLLTDVHWQTDGEWKESVIRKVLRRHLPATALVSRGFVVKSDGATTQIDILIHDASKPVLFRDSDLVFVTPDAVIGIVEVKTYLDSYKFKEALSKLAKNIELIRLAPNSRAFSALFAFEASPNLLNDCLDHVVDAAPTWNHRLDFAAIGDSGFVKYWGEDPENTRRTYQSWHSYELNSLAAGYFLHNVIDAVSPQSVLSNNDVWFPSTGKEPCRINTRRGSWV